MSEGCLLAKDPDSSFSAEMSVPPKKAILSSKWLFFLFPFFVCFLTVVLHKVYVTRCYQLFLERILPQFIEENMVTCKLFKGWNRHFHKSLNYPVSWNTKRISLGCLSEGSAGEKGNGVSRKKKQSHTKRAIIHKIKMRVAVRVVSIWDAFGGAITAILHEIVCTHFMITMACTVFICMENRQKSLKALHPKLEPWI